jgi:hypothetical protein
MPAVLKRGSVQTHVRTAAIPSPSCEAQVTEDSMTTIVMNGSGDS